MKALVIILTLFVATAGQAREFSIGVANSVPKKYLNNEAIYVDLEGQKLNEVTLDATGERGATVTLFVNERAYTTFNMTTFRKSYYWDISGVKAQSARIQFGRIDPLVYGYNFTYDAPVRVKTKIVTRTVIKKVTKRHVHGQADSILNHLDDLMDLNSVNDGYYDFFKHYYRVAFNLERAGGASRLSDASYQTNQDAIELIRGLDCRKGQEILWHIGSHSSSLRRSIQGLQKHLSRLRVIKQFFYRSDCSTKFTSKFFTELGLESEEYEEWKKN